MDKNKRKKMLSILAHVQVLLEIINLKSSKKGNFRRWWVRPHLRLRNYYGAYKTLFKYFKNFDHEEFKKLTRLSPRQFDILHTLLKRKLTKKSTFRQPLSSEMRLAAVVCFLAQGGSVNATAILFRIGSSTMKCLIRDVCKVMAETLLPIYMPTLNEENWTKIAHNFENRWQMNHCLGALDGRHFSLRKPPKAGSIFYNYKKFHSMVLLATCDAEKRFTWYNVGHYGSFNDANLFNSSDLYQGLQNDTIGIPGPAVLPGTNNLMPYYFVGDDIFALSKNLMKPYNRNGPLTIKQKIFNYRLSRARLTIECSFGILVSRWRVFDRDLPFNLKTCENIIISTILLHNFIITQNLLTKDNENYLDEDNDRCNADAINRNANDLVDAGNSAQQRNILADYFSSEAGSVTWQYNRI